MWRLGVFSCAANGWEKHPRIFLVSSVPSILHRPVYAGAERDGVGGDDRDGVALGAVYRDE